MDCNPDHFVSCSKFIEYMHNADIGSFGQWQFANGFNMGVTASKVAINVLQSEQPEHKRGKWIMHIDNLFPAESTMECDQCHEHQPVNIDDNFCPNCGSEMREESEDE